MTFANPDIRTAPRADFEARVKMALALTLKLERKLTQWGEAMDTHESAAATA